MDSSQGRYWVRFISMWTNEYRVNSFDSLSEADWFAKQMSGEVYDYDYKVVSNYGFRG